MRLSIIIVNYNVRYFLEQALLSVQKAVEGLDAEVFVVDNHSADDSVEMVRRRFPWVRLIANDDNPGFSKANNQAIRQSCGEYVLLLNPDTLVQEDTFSKCLNFMDAHPGCGGLGVKMIDGSGIFLPESKRGFPTPFVAFCKTFGLSKLFPKSPVFNQYHLGFLSDHETHPVDVLAGAYMMLRKSVLDEIGLLDEAFFMYGEDIDLSYRIRQAGYENYYYPHTTIIHYKGESTKKGSLNYVKVFYQAMIIFAKKHFQGSGGRLFVRALQAAIYLRAAITLLSNLYQKMALPLLDALLIGLGLVALKDFWAHYYYHNPDYYHADFLWVNVPLYVTVWILSIFFSGGYDDASSLRRPARGLFLGTVVLAAIYGFLPVAYRSSRMLILLGAFWAFLAVIGTRGLAHFLRFGNWDIGQARPNNLAIVGSDGEVARAMRLLQKARVHKNIIGSIGTGAGHKDELCIGHLPQLDEIVRIYKINELVFCSKDVTPGGIMSAMSRLGASIHYKILPEASISIIGSHSKNQSGELYTMDVAYRIAQPIHRRNKRMLDFILSVCVLLASPLLLFRVGNKWGLFRNVAQVLAGRKTWVAYSPSEQTTWTLPKLRPGVLQPCDAFPQKITDSETLHRLDFFYAKDYAASEDLGIVWKGLKGLGNKLSPE